MAGLVCHSCGKEMDTPTCCGSPMKQEGDRLVCASCGSSKPTPTCCGAPMHAH